MCVCSGVADGAADGKHGYVWKIIGNLVVKIRRIKENKRFEKSEFMMECVLFEGNIDGKLVCDGTSRAYFF